MRKLTFHASAAGSQNAPYHTLHKNLINVASINPFIQTLGLKRHFGNESLAKDVR